MLKSILYFGLMVCGLGAAVVNPIWGVVTCILTYLVNPGIFDPTGNLLRYQLFSTVVLLVSTWLHMGQGVRRSGKETLILYWLWAFTLIGFIGIPVAEVSSQVAFTAFIELAKTILLVSIFPKVIRTERDLRLVMGACIVGALHGGVMTILGPRLDLLPSSSRDFTIFPDASQGVLTIFVPLIVLIAAMGRGVIRWLAWIALVFVLDGVVKSYERTGLVVIAVEAAALLLFIPFRLAMKVAPVLLAAGAAFLLVFTPADYWARMTTILDPTEEASANSRFVIFQASVKMLRDHPLGVGYRNYPVVSPRYLRAEMLTEGTRAAHNSFMTIACETGVPGVLFWGGTFLGAALLLRRVRKQSTGPEMRDLWICSTGCEVGLYGWMVGGMTQSWHEVDPAYWFVAFAVVLHRVHRDKLAEGSLPAAVMPSVVVPAAGTRAPEPPKTAASANPNRFTRPRS